MQVGPGCGGHTSMKYKQVYFISLCFYIFFTEWCLIDISQLNTIVNNVNCPQCLTPSLKLTRKEDGWLGFCYLLALECSTCEVTCSTSYSSQQTDCSFLQPTRSWLHCTEAVWIFIWLGRFTCQDSPPERGEDNFNYNC